MPKYIESTIETEKHGISFEKEMIELNYHIIHQNYQHIKMHIYQRLGVAILAV